MAELYARSSWIGMSVGAQVILSLDTYDQHIVTNLRRRNGT